MAQNKYDRLLDAMRTLLWAGVVVGVGVVAARRLAAVFRAGVRR